MSFESLEELYANDADKSENGAEMDVGLNAKGEPIVFIVAEMGNSKSERAMRKYERALASSRYDRKKRMKIWAKILAEAILLDWRGVIDKDGNEVPPTLENRIEALSKYERLFMDVMEFSQNPNNFRPDSGLSPEEESEKNSPNGPPGTQDTESS